MIVALNQSFEKIMQEVICVYRACPCADAVINYTPVPVVEQIERAWRPSQEPINQFNV